MGGRDNNILLSYFFLSASNFSGTSQTLILGAVSCVRVFWLAIDSGNTRMDIHFFQPPEDKYLAYIDPIAPIPISPMEG